MLLQCCVIFLEWGMSPGMHHVFLNRVCPQEYIMFSFKWGMSLGMCHVF